MAPIFLGDEPTDVDINSPSAHSRARWMAKVIYKFTCFDPSFISHLNVNFKGLKSTMRSLSVKLFPKAGYTNRSAAVAPRNDLQFLNDLVA
jgi:hypothetical protein